MLTPLVQQLIVNHSKRVYYKNINEHQWRPSDNQTVELFDIYYHRIPPCCFCISSANEQRVFADISNKCVPNENISYLTEREDQFAEKSKASVQNSIYLVDLPGLW